MAEISREVFALALEVTRGDDVTPPTHSLNMEGMLTPTQAIYRPKHKVGVRAKNLQSEIVGVGAEWEVEGGADVTKLPLLGNMTLMPLSAGVAAGGQVTGTTSLVGGTGYVPATQTDAFTIGVGAPAAGGRQAVIYATTASGVITSLRIADPGSHYTSAPALTFTGHTGTGASATATVAASATTAKQWEFIREMLDDTTLSATLYNGDPTQAILKSVYGMVDELSFSGDASSEDGVTVSAKGFAYFPEELTGGSIPALPAVVVGPLLLPRASQVWMEPNETAAFGTTELTGRLVSAEVTTPTGNKAKHLAVGPAGGLNFSRTGAEPVAPTLKLVFDLMDQTQYNLYEDGQTVKVRLRFNGRTAIEGAIYPSATFDIKGKMADLSWGDLEGTNRTMEVEIEGEYEDEIASDLRMIVINSSATL